MDATCEGDSHLARDSEFGQPLTVPNQFQKRKPAIMLLVWVGPMSK